MGLSRRGTLLGLVVLLVAAALIGLYWFEVGGVGWAPSGPAAQNAAHTEAKKGPQKRGSVRSQWDSTGGNVSGRVLLAANRHPVSGALVRFARLHSAERRAETDFRGLFVLRGIPEGTEYEITVTKAAYAVVRRKDLVVEEGRDTDAGVFLLSAPITLVAHVEDGSGKAIGEATVDVYSVPPEGLGTGDRYRRSMTSTATPSPSATVKTEANGLAQVHGLAPGRYAVAAVAPGYARNATELWLFAGRARKTVVLKLFGAHSLSGTVTDEKGRPMKGRVLASLGALSAWTPGSDYVAQTSQIGAGGRYSFSHLRSGKWDLVVLPTKGPPVPAGDVAVPNVARYDIRLAPAFTVEGTVTDASARPIEGAHVRALMLGYSQGVLGAKTVTSSDGSYEIDGLRSELPFGICVRKSGFAPYPSPQHPHPTFVPRAHGVIRIDVTLSRGVSITGTVTSKSHGRPISGAHVFAVLAQGMGRTGRVEASATTGSAGRYVLRDLAPWKYVLFAKSPGYFQPGLVAPYLGVPGKTPARYTVTLHKAKATTVRNLVLSLGGSVSGRVVRKDGSGASGFGVSVVESGFGDLTPRIASGPGGAFRLSGVPPGKKLRVRAWRQGSSFESEPFDLDPGGSASGITITIADEARVSGRVTLPDGSPASSGVVYLTTNAASPYPGFWRLQTFGMTPCAVGSDGTFSGDIAVQELRDLTAFAVVAGYPVARSGSVLVKPGGNVSDVHVELAGGATIRGSVVDRQGSPVPEARVTLDLAHRKAKGSELLVETSTRTDPDGTFSFRGVIPGTYNVTAFEPGYSTARAQISTGTGEAPILTMAKGGTIRGRVTDRSGKPVGGVILRLSCPHPVGQLPRSVTATDGTFVLAGVPDGVYRVEATPGDTGLPYLPATADGATPGGPTVALELSHGLSVSGRVVGESGDPLLGVHVTTTIARHPGPNVLRRDVSGPDGTFSLSGLPEGDLTLSASQRGYAPARLHTEAGATGLTITMSAPLTIAGRVVDSSGEPQEHMSLTATFVGDPGMPQVWATSDASGHFEFGGLAPGQYRIVLSTGFGHYSAAPETVDAGETGVAIHVETVATLTVTTVDAKGRPVPKACVQMKSKGPGGDKYTLVDYTSSSGTLVCKKVPPGELHLDACSEASNLVLADPVTVAEGTKHVELVLKPGTVLQGRVVDASGNGLVNATVSVDCHNSVRTGKEGSFSVRALRPGPVNLTIESPVTGHTSKRTVTAGAGEVVVTVP